MNAKSDYINWACCQIVTFLLFNCLPSPSLSLTSHIFSPASCFACLLFPSAGPQSWLFPGFCSLGFPELQELAGAGGALRSLGTPHKGLCFLLQGHRNAKVELENTKGSVSEPVCDGLCYHRDYWLLLYSIWEEIIIPHVSVCVCFSCSNTKQDKSCLKALCGNSRGGFTFSGVI